MAHRLIPVPEARAFGEGSTQIARELLKSVAIEAKIKGIRTPNASLD